MNAHTPDDWFNPDATTFGDRIAGAREQAGLSQEGLAERLGVKLKTIEKWEEDADEPSARYLTKVAGVLNVSITWLINGAGEGLNEIGDVLLEQNATDILNEIRELQSVLSHSAARLAQLEATLKAALETHADE